MKMRSFFYLHVKGRQKISLLKAWLPFEPVGQTNSKSEFLL